MGLYGVYIYGSPHYRKYFLENFWNYLRQCGDPVDFSEAVPNFLSHRRKGSKNFSEISQNLRLKKL